MVNFPSKFTFGFCSKFGLGVAPLPTISGGLGSGLTLGCVLIGVIFPGPTKH